MAKKHPYRSLEQVARITSRMDIGSTGSIDGCEFTVLPGWLVRISSNASDAVETLTWDSFYHLWLRNVECDEAFSTKPELAKPI